MTGAFEPSSLCLWWPAPSSEGTGRDQKIRYRTSTRGFVFSFLFGKHGCHTFFYLQPYYSGQQWTAVFNSRGCLPPQVLIFCFPGADSLLQVLMRALRDFNVPKIVVEDMPVFMGLIGDLFPALDVPRKRDLELEKNIHKATVQVSLQPEDNFILKVNFAKTAGSRG